MTMRVADTASNSGPSQFEVKIGGGRIVEVGLLSR